MLCHKDGWLRYCGRAASASDCLWIGSAFFFYNEYSFAVDIRFHFGKKYADMLSVIMFNSFTELWRRVSLQDAFTVLAPNDNGIFFGALFSYGVTRSNPLDWKHNCGMLCYKVCSDRKQQSTFWGSVSEKIRFIVIVILFLVMLQAIIAYICQTELTKIFLIAVTFSGLSMVCAKVRQKNNDKNIL